MPTKSVPPNGARGEIATESAVVVAAFTMVRTVDRACPASESVHTIESTIVPVGVVTVPDVYVATTVSAVGVPAEDSTDATFTVSACAFAQAETPPPTSANAPSSNSPLHSFRMHAPFRSDEVNYQSE